MSSFTSVLQYLRTMSAKNKYKQSTGEDGGNRASIFSLRRVIAKPARLPQSVQHTEIRTKTP